jgi:hypothetical protein
MMVALITSPGSATKAAAVPPDLALSLCAAPDRDLARKTVCVTTSLIRARNSLHDPPARM